MKINMKINIFYIIAGALLLFGIAGTIYDLSLTKKEARDLLEHRVITAKDVAEYKSISEENTVFITGVKLEGEKISDPKKYIEGEYYMIIAESQFYSPRYDDDGNEERDNSPENNACWGIDSKYNFEVMGEGVHTNLGEDIKIEKSMIFGLPVTAYGYPRGIENVVSGDIRYAYKCVDEGTEFTVLATIGNGKLELKKMYEMHDPVFITGGIDAAKKYLEDFLVGDSYVFLILGIIGGLLFGFLGIVFGGKKDAK